MRPCFQNLHYYSLNTTNQLYVLDNQYLNIYYQLHYEKINYIDNIDYYKNIGIRSFRLELLDETYDEVIKLINEIRK